MARSRPALHLASLRPWVQARWSDEVGWMRQPLGRWSAAEKSGVGRMVEGSHCERSRQAVSEGEGCSEQARAAYVVQLLEHALQHPWPFAAVEVVSMRPVSRDDPDCAYMSMLPSRAAVSSICSGEDIFVVVWSLAQKFKLHQFADLA